MSHFVAGQQADVFGLQCAPRLAKTPRLMQQGAAGRMKYSKMVGVAVLLVATLASCSQPENPDINGYVGGRVLLAPGVGLAHAHIEIDQLQLYDGKAEVRKHVGATETDDQGFFPAVPTSSVNGLLLFDVSGGTFSELVTGARIQLDATTHMKALHWLDPFQDRGSDIFITPVHALVEARFRFKMREHNDTIKAVAEAYDHINAHFGKVDWETVVPADLSKPATSPIDEVRASFVLGGFALLADDLRAASESTPQVVNITTLLAAVEQDISDQLLDGNDSNNRAPRSGLQVGDCAPAAASCEAATSECVLGACRPLCDLFVNSYRSYLAGDVSKFIGSQVSSSVWNKTGLSTQDARTLIDGIARNMDPDLFAPDACFETADRTPPSIGWDTRYDDRLVQDGDLVRGAISIRIVATDDTDLVPKASFELPVKDTDGDPTNSIAVASVDSRAAVGSGGDGTLTITAHAMDSAGNIATSKRTFQVDNTPPEVAFLPTGLIVDNASVWWTDSDHPVLHGTVSDPHIDRVEIVLGGQVVATAAITGTAWTATLPDHALAGTDNIVTIRAVDSVGNATSRTQTVRVDATPPIATVASSPVFDEINSTFQFVDDANGSRANHIPHGTPVELATTESCPTLHKYVHLLSQPGPNGTHSVLGSAGELNPLNFNVVMSDDGVGLDVATAEYRVGILNGAAVNFLTGWLPLTGGVVQGTNTTRFVLPLYRDGARGLPALGNTRGEYHIELRVRDRFGRAGTTARCWQHEILAPPTRATNEATGANIQGTPAYRRPDSLFSTRLDPNEALGERADFSTKFLNSTAEGGAVWSNKFKNYLDAPIFVTVQVSKDAAATVSRQFVIRSTLVNPTAASTSCGTQPCLIAQPAIEYTSQPSNSTQTVLKSTIRVFDVSAGRAEISPCSGCTNDADAQVFQFRIPPRSEAAGSSPHEYEIVTVLQTGLPSGQGTNVTLAPVDGNQPDSDPSPYTEVAVSSTVPNDSQGSGTTSFSSTITGKLIGPPSTSLVCIEQDNDSGEFICLKKARRQRYRALKSVTYALTINSVINTSYATSATAQLPLQPGAVGALRGSQPESGVVSTESLLP